MTTYPYIPSRAAGPYEGPDAPLDAWYISGNSSPATSSAAADVGLSSASAGSSILLTPDDLMSYCQARLHSIDDQVNGVFGQQQLRNSESSALQGVVQTFQEFTDGVTSDATSCTKMETALHDLIEHIKATDRGCPELPKLEQTYNDLLYSGTDATTDLPYEDKGLYPPKHTDPPGDSTLGSTEMQSFISNLQGCASDMNSGSELQMIQLQSLMSQRQTAIQLTTNLVQSLGDQGQKIAENIGR